VGLAVVTPDSRPLEHAATLEQRPDWCVCDESHMCGLHWSERNHGWRPPRRHRVSREFAPSLAAARRHRDRERDA
jgi:hypothetical protein